jgi:nucleotidyltransferase/DNA polymerase involved in DNA repair
VLPMSDSPRAIVHLDLDAFFAAVEVLENPD